jgi:hypothetical protein
MPEGISRASCLALAESITVSTETTKNGKLEAEAGLDACRNAGYISSAEYAALMEKLNTLTVGTVIKAPGEP